MSATEFHKTRTLDGIFSNSNKMLTVKHLSKNQKQEVQHKEKQLEKLLESVRQVIKETDPYKESAKTMQTKTKNSERKL